jgi:primosomal replication protein N
VDANAVVLTGRIVELAPLRHTPAGIPLLTFRIAHRSLQREAGMERQAECEVSGMAIGEAASCMCRFKTGDSIKASGFLSRKNRMSTQLVLHVNQTELLEETNHAQTSTTR